MSSPPPVVSPTSLADALEMLAGPDHWRPMAGGTDLLVQLTGELGPAPERVLDIWRLDQLREISLTDDRLEIGALVTYTDLRHSALIADLLPVAGEVAATIGALQIQNRGTVGGNLGNASPAGDTLPLWLAADADLILGSTAGERRIPAIDFFTGYRQTARRADELILGVSVPLTPRRQFRFHKVGTRRAQAISKVVMVLGWVPAPDGSWQAVRLALGSVAPTPIRAGGAEAALEGSHPDASVADRAVAALERDIHPIDDVRSSADYRGTVAGNVLHRLLRTEGGW